VAVTSRSCGKTIPTSRCSAFLESGPGNRLQALHLQLACRISSCTTFTSSPFAISMVEELCRLCRIGSCAVRGKQGESAGTPFRFSAPTGSLTMCCCSPSATVAKNALRCSFIVISGRFLRWLSRSSANGPKPETFCRKCFSPPSFRDLGIAQFPRTSSQ